MFTIGDRVTVNNGKNVYRIEGLDGHAAKLAGLDGTVHVMHLQAVPRWTLTMRGPGAYIAEDGKEEIQATGNFTMMRRLIDQANAADKPAPAGWDKIEGDEPGRDTYSPSTSGV